ncbi:MAG: DUF1576 domain-containing protein [Lachnospiraceae bacterium]|nr:DUF1576 domain-containing protein [Lachnospiraceae bacterium]
MKELIRKNGLKYFTYITLAMLYFTAVCFSHPQELASGLRTIILSRDALVTDYFELVGYGPAFLNAALVMTISLVMIEYAELPFTGLTMAAVFINTGFGFWGKNVVNILPIHLGTILYAKAHNVSMSRYTYTALFATCLAPFVTELTYILPFGLWKNLAFAILAGIFIGYILPPLSQHTASMHMGYSLFNVGFSGGTLAFVMFCVLKSLGISSESVFIWKAERHPMLITGIYVYLVAAFLLGLYINEGKLKNLLKIFKHPGRAVADFVLMDGPGATLMNMSLTATAGLTYAMLIGADFSGPVLGCLFTVFGFAAFGAHLRNYLPVLLGVYLSTFFSQHSPTDAGILIAAFFVVGISPIAGQFGPIWGILSGMLHACIVMCTSAMYGGLNLYNNGFSCGWVAIVMIPTIESFMRSYEVRKQKIKEKKENRKQ